MFIEFQVGGCCCFQQSGAAAAAEKMIWTQFRFGSVSGDAAVVGDFGGAFCSGSVSGQRWEWVGGKLCAAVVDGRYNHLTDINE